ncbi:hypothetical protein RJ640_009413 [Escallonia rubra]|uniref:Inhibitor I9 domain-containing protein n=1 Tax=Escallonia rubra TaxID=112253 RepID=A0AA88QSL9_9ASTE|nr:hypothetical protein RJ640_009413 [Escallonia rubra]
MVARGVAHLMWNEGWPQPGEREKGKGGVDAKGGHGDGGVEQVCPVVPVANISKRTAAAKCGGGRGGMGKCVDFRHRQRDSAVEWRQIMDRRSGSGKAVSRWLTGEEKKRDPALAYIVYMGDRPKAGLQAASVHTSLLQEVLGSNASASLLYNYGRSFNGFVVKLTKDEMLRVSGL